MRTPVAAGSYAAAFDNQDGTAGTRWSIFKSNGNKWSAFAGSQLDGATTVATSTTYVVAARFNGSSSSIWVNGASDGTGATGNNTFQQIEIGNFNGETFAAPWLFEICIYNTVLSDGDLSAACSAMNATWAVY